MSFFTSPMKLIQIITQSELINSKTEAKKTEWYRSTSGKSAYNNATTFAEKLEYYYGYLQSHNKFKKHMGRSLAYIMTVAQDGTDKPYGTWPSILMPESNPLIKYALSPFDKPLSASGIMAAKEGISPKEAKQALKSPGMSRALNLIAAFHNNCTPEKFFNPENLTRFEDDEHMYFLEHTIIFAMCGGNHLAGGIGPFYCYSKIETEEESDDD